ncbi:MAG: hypothetical protein VX670_11940, partial [Candidatus Latescibacterota bacterium]|nr:hypothetical protein [Candidatus Latescibacterota bacterium]
MGHIAETRAPGRGQPTRFVEVAVDGGAFFDSHRLDGGAASEGALAAGGDQGVLNRNSRLAKRTESGQ